MAHAPEPDGQSPRDTGAHRAPSGEAASESRASEAAALPGAPADEASDRAREARPASARSAASAPSGAAPQRPAPEPPQDPSAASAGSAAPREVAEIPIGMRRAAAWSWRILLVLLLTAVVLYMLTRITTLLIPVLVALLATAILSPIVTRLSRYLPLGRGLAAAVALLGLIVLVLGMSALAGQQLIGQYQDISEKAVAGFDQVVHWANTSLKIDNDLVSEYTNKGIEELKKNAGTIATGALSGVSTIGNVVTGVVIALFSIFFMLKDGSAMWSWALRLLPRAARPSTDRSFRRGWTTLASYMRTQVIVAAVDASGIAIGMLAVGLGAYAIPIWLIVFLFAFIPIVGALLSGFLAVLIALVLKGWVIAIVMVAVTIAVNQIESNVLQPFLMGKAVALHPLAVFLGVTLGTILAGIPGALFAIPFMAFANSTIQSLAGGEQTNELDVKDSSAVV